MSLSFGAPLGVLIGASLGWQIVFAGIGLLSLLLVWANSGVWHDHPAAIKPAAPHDRLTMAAIAPRLAPTVVWSTAVYAMYTYLGGGLTSFGYSAAETAEIVLFYGCGAISGVLIGGRMADRLGAKLTIAIALLGLCLCFFLLRLALDAGVLVGCALGLSSAMAQLFFPAQQVRLAQRFPSRRATILAWNNSALFLGISLGSLIGGQAVSLGGFDLDLMIAAAIAVVGWMTNLEGRPEFGVRLWRKLSLATTRYCRSYRPSGTPEAR
jgi:predicted MFS family arabinose efflux permease